MAGGQRYIYLHKGVYLGVSRNEEAIPAGNLFRMQRDVLSRRRDVGCCENVSQADNPGERRLKRALRCKGKYLMLLAASRVARLNLTGRAFASWHWPLTCSPSEKI